MHGFLFRCIRIQRKHVYIHAFQNMDRKKKAIQLVKRHCEIVFTSAIPIYPENFLSLERGALYHSPNIPTDGWLVKVVIPTDNQSV